MYLNAVVDTETDNTPYLITAKPRNMASEEPCLLSDPCAGKEGQCINGYNLGSSFTANVDYDRIANDYPYPRYGPPEDTAMCLRALYFYKYVWDKDLRAIVTMSGDHELTDFSIPDKCDSIQTWLRANRPPYLKIHNNNNRPHNTWCWGNTPCIGNSSVAFITANAKSWSGEPPRYYFKHDDGTEEGSLPPSGYYHIGEIAKQLEKRLFEIYDITGGIPHRHRLAISMTSGHVSVRVRDLKFHKNLYVEPKYWYISGRCYIMKCGLEPWLWDNQNSKIKEIEDVTR